MDNTAMGAMLAIGAALFWGVGNTIARVGLQSIKATSAVILSLVASLTVALIVALLFEFKSLVAVGWFAIIGVLQFALGRLFFIGR